MQLSLLQAFGGSLLGRFLWASPRGLSASEALLRMDREHAGDAMAGGIKNVLVRGALHRAWCFSARSLGRAGLSACHSVG